MNAKTQKPWGDRKSWQIHVLDVQRHKCTHRELRKRLSTGRMYFGHHIFYADWILLSLLNRDLLSSYEAKIKAYNQSRGKNSWHVDINTFRLANVASLDQFKPTADFYKCRSVNIRTISPPMFRSCSLVSQTPVKLDSQSRTWSQQLADRQMPKSWFSAKSDPALIDLTLDTSTIAERPKTNVTYFA